MLPPKQPRWWQRETARVLLLYVCLTVLMTWPLAARLSTHIPGDVEREDHWVHQWTFWWVEQAVVGLENPLYSDLIFFPEGVSLASHNIAWLNIAAWLPLRALVGRVAAYNLMFMGIYIFNGLSLFWLARSVTGRSGPAVVAGIIVAFWPYNISHFDHPNLILLGWIPLALIFLRRVLAGGRRRDVLLTALFVILTGLTRWQLLPPAGVVLGLYVIFAWITDPPTRRPPVLGRLGLILLLSGAVLLPAMLPVLLPTLGETGSEALVIYDRENWQTDLIAYLLPSRYHPLWENIVRPSAVFNNLRSNKLYTPFLGYTTLLLALLGLGQQRRRALFWAFLAAVLMLLALGAVLRVNGVLYPAVPMPFDLLEESLVFRLLRRPDRFNVLLGVPVALLAAWGVAAVQIRLTGRPRLVRLAPILLALLILFESLVWPYPTVSTDIVPAFYQDMAAETDDFAVVDLPLHRVPYKFYMFYQITHGHPTVQGRLARVPVDAYDFIDSIPFLRDIRVLGAIGPDQTPVAAQMAQLAAVNVRYVVIHKDQAPALTWEAWRAWLAAPPYYEDDRVIVFSTASPPPP